MSKPVSLVIDEPEAMVMVRREDGRIAGHLPRRGNLAKAILGGARIGHASWQGVGPSDDNGFPSSLRVRVVLVEEGEHFEMPPAAAPAQYPLGVVGESNYQAAIERCRAGEQVTIIREPSNPFDPLALAVVSHRGETIGYIGRSAWLRDAIHLERKGCEATIKAIHRNERSGLLGIVIDVELTGDTVAERAFHRDTQAPSLSPTQTPHPTGGRPQPNWLSRLLKW